MDKKKAGMGVMDNKRRKAGWTIKGGKPVPQIGRSGKGVNR
jgi:hypothetical protein